MSLEIAGLLQLSLDGNTSRIPGLGDLPILGPFFQNTTGMRMEKELLVLVTPYLVEPMNPGQVPPVEWEMAEFARGAFYYENELDMAFMTEIT